jgi:hypothetical protein
VLTVYDGINSGKVQPSDSIFNTLCY